MCFVWYPRFCNELVDLHCITSEEEKTSTALTYLICILLLTSSHVLYDDHADVEKFSTQPRKGMI